MLRFTQDETQGESFQMRLFKNTRARSNAGWNFHKLVAPIDLVKPPGGFKNTDAIAIYCEKCDYLYRYKSGDGKLLTRHMSDKHGDFMKQIIEAQTKLKESATDGMRNWLVGCKKKMPIAGCTEQQKLNVMLAKWIAESYRPVSIVEDDGFINLIEYANQLSAAIKLPRRTSMTEQIRKLASEKRAELRKMIAGKNLYLTTLISPLDRLMLFRKKFLFLHYHRHMDVTGT